MGQRKYNKGALQIAVGAACLAGAWYYGQVSSAKNSPDLKAERPPLKAEDLVWNDYAQSPPPLASGSVANLAEHMNAVPELAKGFNSGSSTQSSGTPPSGQGPMIVEPDFSEMERTYEQGQAGSQLASISRNPNAVPHNQLQRQFPEPSINTNLRDDHVPELAPTGVGDFRIGVANGSGNGEISVLAKPALPNSNDTGPSGMAPISARGSSQIEVNSGGFRMHVVRAGETLQSLSREYFGSPDYYLDIYVANQDVLTSPAAVRNGMSLRIPLNDNQ